MSTTRRTLPSVANTCIKKERLQQTRRHVLTACSFTAAHSLLRVRFRACLRVTKLSQHETDGGKFQEREGVAVEIFPILGEAAATVEPRNGAFDGPTLG